MSKEDLESALMEIGFARFEVQCLLYLARSKKASAKRLSRDTNIPHNLAKVMLQNLVNRQLITAHQDSYEFAGVQTLSDYLSTEKSKINKNYDAAEEALKGFL